MASATGSSKLYAEKRGEPSHDWGLLLSALLLYFVGLASVGSISYAEDHGATFFRQILNGALGLVVFLVFSVIKLDFWRRAATALYITNIVMLTATLIIGTGPNGVKRWLPLGPLSFQPSELTKILVAISLAAFFANRQDNLKSPVTFAGALLHLAPIVLLVFKEPHNGAALALICVGLAAAIYAGVPWKFFPVAFAGLALLIVGAWLTPGVIPEYAKGRVQAMVTAKETGKKDIQGDDYQQYVAELAIGNGGVLGQGYLKGDQKSAGNVPVQSTDFIFTVIAEEGGFFGSIIALACFGFFFFRVWLVTFKAESVFAKVLAGSIFTGLGVYTVVNLCMVLQLGPVVGLGLPFVSYGGTSLWMTLAALALLDQCSQA